MIINDSDVINLNDVINAKTSAFDRINVFIVDKCLKLLKPNPNRKI